MMNILKCMIALFVELNIYQCLGYAMSKIKFLPDVKSFVQKEIYGFLGYHVLFWCISFPCTLLNRTLNHLAILWGVSFFIIILIIIFYHFKDLVETYKNAAFMALQHKLFLIPFLILEVILIYYVCVNGQIDIDARTYIGEVTSMVDTGKLVGISITSGKEIQMIQFKRSFSMFSANSAVLCKIFHVHPLVFCRTTRAALNVLLFTGTALEIFKRIFYRKKDTIKHAILGTMLTIGILFSFTNTAYTEARFLLYRAYEGKAYCASTLVLVTILIAIKLCESEDYRYFVILFLDMLAGMSISPSATFILPLVGGCIILAYTIYQRKWSYIPILLLSFLFNIIYICLSISGFSGFHLEG